MKLNQQNLINLTSQKQKPKSRSTLDPLQARTWLEQSSWNSCGPNHSQFLRLTNPQRDRLQQVKRKFQTSSPLWSGLGSRNRIPSWRQTTGIDWYRTQGRLVIQRSNLYTTAGEVLGAKAPLTQRKLGRKPPFITTVKNGDQHFTKPQFKMPCFQLARQSLSQIKLH